MKTIEIDSSRLIAYWLYKRDMSQKELSDRLEVTRGRITQMLGKKNIRTDILSKLARVFGVSPSEFIEPAERNYKDVTQGVKITRTKLK